MASDAFQKVKATWNRGVATISVKTSSSLEKAKIKTHIESINAEIARLIVASGEAAYTIWESGESDFSSLNAQFAAIKEKKEEILRLEADYAAIDDRDNQILGTQASDEAVPAAPVQAEEERPACPNCGESYATGAKFCRKCGQKLQE